MNKYYELIILGTLLNNLFKKKYIILIKEFLFKNLTYNFFYFLCLKFVSYNKKLNLELIYDFLTINLFFGLNVDFLIINSFLCYCLDYLSYLNLVVFCNYFYSIVNFKNKVNIYFKNFLNFSCYGNYFIMLLMRGYLSDCIKLYNFNFFDDINKFSCLKNMLLSIVGINKLFIANTGIIGLDKYINGLYIGDLIVVAGRPSVGKTTFGINIASYLFINFNIPVLFFSLEMTMFQILFKFLMIILNNSNIKKKFLRDNINKKKVLMACSLLKSNNISIIDHYIDSLDSMEGIINNWSLLNNRSGIIIIDYLQLLCFNSSIGRTFDISIISRALKNLSKRYKTAIIALSQMNRNIEHCPDRDPILSDIRDSGSIEQDADIIIFLHKKIDNLIKYFSYFPIKLIVAKNRNGLTGSSIIFYDLSSTRFYYNND